MRVAVSITLTHDERATLQRRWARGRSVEARRVLRAKIVLAAATGQQNKEIADELGTLARRSRCGGQPLRRAGAGRD